MPCPKCGGALDWKEPLWTVAGEDPGHWRCINCGELIYQGQKKVVPETKPQVCETNSAKTETEEDMREMKKCEECEKDFEPRRCDQRFCNPDCAHAYYLAHPRPSVKKGGNNGGKKTEPVLPREIRKASAATPDETLLVPIDVLRQLNRAVWKQKKGVIMERIEKSLDELFA